MTHLPEWTATIHHDGSSQHVTSLFPQIGEEITLRLRVSSQAPIRRVLLRTFPDGEQALMPMQQELLLEDVQWYQIKILIREPRFHYRFILEAEDGIWFFNAAGTTQIEPLDYFDFQILANYSSPTWVQKSIFYQIFPDRFASSNPNKGPKPEEFDYRGIRPKTFPWENEPDANQPFSLVFYGGDLSGIAKKLDYLCDLGITGIYLNPIFTAFSNHKYDVIDYDHVDPHFGGDHALIELREQLNSRQMKFILDIVPNHCGYWHPWFQAARLQPDAPESAFFTFHQRPDNYESWLGVWSLPKLDYRSPELRKRMYESDHAVFRRWLLPPFNADGWRVDVANMLGRQGTSQLGDQIAREIRIAVKEANPDSYFVGENFFDATPQLQGDQFDAVMNYSGFTKPLWHWLRGYQQGAIGLQDQIISELPWSTENLLNSWQQHLAVIPWQVALQQFNLLGSHDTSRIRTVVNSNNSLVALAAILLFTFPGVPCIYYGDEIGMEDLPGLKSRGCMDWDSSHWDQELLSLFRHLIQLRKTNSALQTGGFQVLEVQENAFLFQRVSADERLIIVANRSQSNNDEFVLSNPQLGIRNKSTFEAEFSRRRIESADGKLQLPVLGQGGEIWRQTNP